MTSPRLEKILETMVSSIVEADAVERHAADPSRYFEGRGLEARDAESLSKTDPKAWFVYRHLVRGTLRGTILHELPRTRALLAERFDEEIEAFLSSGLPTSHYLRDVANDFVDFVAQRWPSNPAASRAARAAQLPEVPAFALDLARHELVAFESAAARPPTRASDARPEAKLELERPVVLHESTRLVRYDYPVHEHAEGALELAPRETFLVVYRDHDHDLRYLELSELAFEIVGRLLGGAVLKAALVEGCAKAGAVMTPELLQDVAKLLADYAERGILLGSAADAAPVEQSSRMRSS